MLQTPTCPPLLLCLCPAPPFSAPAYLAYTSCSQSPFLAKAGSSASASWVFNETGAYYSHWSGGGGDCLRKRRRNLLDSATAAEYSLGNLKAKTQDGSCTLGVKASGGTQSCLNTSVSLEKTSKPVRFGVRWVSKGKRYPFEHPPGEYQVFVYVSCLENTMKQSQMYLHWCKELLELILS